MTTSGTSATLVAGRVARGAGALSLSAVVGILGQVSLVPIAMSTWGKAAYGEWLLLAGLVTILKVTDIGLQTYVVNEITASHVRQERERLHRTLHSALLIEYPLAALVLVVVVATLAVVPLDAWLGLRAIDGWELRAVGALLAAEVLIGVPMGTIAGMYRATGRLVRAAMIGTAQQTAILGATLLLVAFDGDFWLVAVARVTFAVAGSAFIVADLKVLNPWLRLWPSTGRVRDGLQMIAPGLLFLCVPVADYVSTQLVLLVLQRGTDAAEVSRLATHRMFVNFAVMLSGVVLNAAWPELTALDAGGDRARVSRLQRTLVKFNLWLAGGVALLMWPLARLVYSRWTAHEIQLDEWVLGILIVRVVMWSVWNVCATTLMATNHHRAVTAALWASTLLTMALAVLLVPRWGVQGAALAWLAGDAGVCLWVIPRLACSRLGDALRDFWCNVAGSALWGLGLPFAVAAASWHVAASPLIQYGVVIPVASALALLSMLYRLSPMESEMLRSLGARISARIG